MAATDFWSGAGGPLVSAGVGLIGLPFQIASQRRQQDITRSGIEAQLRAQNAAIENSAMLGREGWYAQLGESLGARNFGQTAADLDFGRQLKAQEWQLGPGAEKESAIFSDRARRGFALQNFIDAREQSQRANREALKASLAEKEAAMAGMFGRIAPRDVGTMFV
jgi:hypothetical protein